MSDVGAYPQPVGVYTSITFISGPALKIGETWREGRSWRYDRPRCREPKKVSARQFDLRDEEVLTRSQIDRDGQFHRDCRFLSGHRTVAGCKNIGLRMYTARLDAVVRCEARLQNNRREAKLPDEEESRLSNATSDGELTLVGTFGVEKVGGPLVRFTSESAGKTRYTSTTTFFISLVDAPDGIRPVKAAPVIEVCWVRTKSSPVSISNFPELSGRVAVAMRPSGLPVLKTKASASHGQRQHHRCEC